MKNIANLLLYISVIAILILLCNKASENIVKPEDETFTEEVKSMPKGFDGIMFDYDTVKSSDEIFDLNKNFNKELIKGASVHPQYNNNTFEDQKVIYDNRMYSKEIHESRTVEQSDHPLTIKEVFDNSITDFKKISPVKKGNNGVFTVEGYNGQKSYIPDFITYDNEKPENGGIYDKLSYQLHGYDPLMATNNSLI